MIFRLIPHTTDRHSLGGNDVGSPQSSGGERKRGGDIPSDDDEFTCSLAEQYTSGLSWVLGYYYQVHVHVHVHVHAYVDGVSGLRVQGVCI